MGADSLGQQVRAVVGDEARRLLADPGFRRDWEGLLSRCAWGTVFQSPWFVSTWLEAYQQEYDPLFVVARSADGVLVGAMFLASRRSTSELVFAGAHQAEYHAFLTSGCDPEAFLRSAVGVLRSVSSRPGLTFHFLAPGSPTGWLTPGPGWGFSVRFQQHARPIMGLSDLAQVQEPLHRKKHKARMSRLARDGGGEVRLVQLHSAAEALPYLDDIIAHCDLRQGAVNRNTPFRSDPNKRRFYLRLLDAPGQVHATVLLTGERMAAAHIGPISGRQLVFGLIVHSALFAQHSPGKVLVVLLGPLLAEQGIEALDLTPGEGYKNQHATHSDVVHSVQLYWDTGAFFRQSARAVLRRAVVRIARATGVNVDAVERARRIRNRALNWKRWPHAAGVLLQKAREWAWKDVEFRVMVAVDPAPDPPAGPSGRIRAQHLADLLDFSPPSGLHDDYYAFLSEALSRLERGQRCYTHGAEGVLLHYSWLIPSARECGTGLGHQPLAFTSESAVLWDDYTHPAARGKGLHLESVCLRLADTAVGRPGGRAFVGVHADNGPSRRNYERCGFTWVASAWYRRRAGTTRRWFELSPTAAGLLVAPTAADQDLSQAKNPALSSAAPSRD